jgi:Zn-finger nucleic acid-binding protein
MHEVNFEGVVLDFCDACHGIWFDADELAFTAELATDIPEIAAVKKDARTTPHTCPRCGEPQKLEEMKFLQAQELLVDRCPQCKGIWIDKGELPKIEAMAARIGDAKSKVLLTARQLRAQGYQILGIKT